MLPIVLQLQKESIGKWSLGGNRDREQGRNPVACETSEAESVESVG
jgi:hypothetical protein